MMMIAIIAIAMPAADAIITMLYYRYYADTLRLFSPIIFFITPLSSMPAFAAAFFRRFFFISFDFFRRFHFLRHC